MGRSSFELHSRPNIGLFNELKNQGHDIIKIVLSNQWKTIPEEYQEKKEENVILCHNWKEVKSSVLQLSHMISEAWNIGGPQVYQAQLEDKYDTRKIEPEKLYVTKLEGVFDCDTFYPIKYLNSLKCIEKSEPKIENGVKYTFNTYDLS